MINDSYDFGQYIQEFLDEKFLIYGHQLQVKSGKIFRVSFKDYSDWDGGVGYEIDAIDYEILNMDLFYHYCKSHDFSELFYRGSLAEGLKVNHWLVQNPWIKLMIDDYEIEKSIQFLPWCKDDVFADYCKDALFLDKEDALEYLEKLKKENN